MITPLEVLQLRVANPPAGERPPQIVGEARLEGVLDPEGHGGIVVTLLTTPLTAITGSDGRYLLTGVPIDEPLTLLFQREGYGTQDTVVPRVNRESTFEIEAPTVLPALPGQVQGLVALDRYSSPAALAAVRVTVTNTDGDRIPQALPDAAGVFVVPDLPAGDYIVTASLTGYQVEPRPITVRVGAITDVGAILLRHDSGTDSAVRLGGTVRLPGQNEHSGTQVRVRFAPGNLPYETVVTDASGHFELSASRSESYNLLVEHPGFELPGSLGPYSWDAATSVFRDEQTNPIDLVMGLSPLNGRITTTFTMGPDWIPEDQRRADVRILGEAYSTGLDSVEAGEESVFGGLAAGTYVVRIQRPGFETFEELVELGVGQTDVEIDDAHLTLRDLESAGLDMSEVDLREGELGPEVSLVGADLTGVDLTGFDFSGRDLRGARFTNARLAGINLSGARLDQVTFFGADLSCTEDSCADLTGAELSFASFFGANLTGARLADANLRGANFSNAVLRDAQFVPDDVTDADLPAPPCAVGGPRPGVVLTGAVFGGADLTNAFMPGVNMPNADFASARLDGTNLRRACLSNVRLTLTDVSRANLDQADMQNASLINTVLQQTSMRGTDLRGASLISAIFERADLGCIERTDDGFCGCDETFEDIDGVCASPNRATWLARCGCHTRMGAANLNGANLVGADFVGADLIDSSLVGVSIGDAAVPPALRPVDCEPACFADPDCAAANRACVVTQTRFADARLDHAIMSGVGLSHADLTGASLAEANLSNVRFFADSTYDHMSLAGANLTGADLSGADFRGVNMSGALLKGTVGRLADIRGATFEGARLEGVDFAGAQTAAVVFDGVRIRGSFTMPLGEAPYFRNADLAGIDASWIPTVPRGTRFDGANLSGVYLGNGVDHVVNGVTERRIDLSGISFRDVTFGDTFSGRHNNHYFFFKDCDFAGADFRTADLRSNLSFTRCTFVGADFRDVSVDLRFLNFDQCDLTGARLVNTRFATAHLTRTSLRDADLTGFNCDDPFDGYPHARFDRVDFAGANVEGASLQTAEFVRSDLRGIVNSPASFANSKFTRSDLRAVDLTAVNLASTTWDEVDLRGATLDRATLTDAVFGRPLLSGASLAGAAATGVTFQATDLQGVDLRGATLDDAAFINSNLDEALTAGASLDGISETGDREFSGRDVRLLDLEPNSCGANLARADARGVTLPASGFTQASFQGARLDGADLSGLDADCASDVPEFGAHPSFSLASLVGATGLGGWANGTSFKGANLTGVSPTGSISGADFSDARFGGAAAGTATCTDCTLRGSGGEFVRLTTGDISRSDLRGVDLSDVDLSGRSFAGSDFEGADLSGATFDRSSSRGVSFRRASLSGASLGFVDLVGANLEEANFEGAEFVANTSFINESVIECANFTGAEMVHLQMDDALNFGCLNLSDASIERLTMLRVPLKNIRLDGARGRINMLLRDLSGSSMVGVNLERSDFGGAFVRGCDASDAVLSSIDGRGADFEGLVARRAEFTAFGGSDARFAHAVLTDATFDGAVLTRADFWEADLSGADLRRADLTDARFTHANLEGAQICPAMVLEVKGYRGTLIIADEGC